LPSSVLLVLPALLVAMPLVALLMRQLPSRAAFAMTLLGGATP